MFLEDSPEDIKCIAEGIKSKKMEDVGTYIHKLKKSAVTIGANKLSNKIIELECAVKKDDIKTMETLLQEVQSEFEELWLFCLTVTGLKW